MPKISLFDDFSSVSVKQWKQKIQYDLKGADYNETLVWESPEGIKVKPCYHADDRVECPENLTSEKVWTVGHTIYAGNALMANEKALKILQMGAESLSFKVPSENTSIEELLKGIDLNRVPIYFELDFLSQKYIESIFEFRGVSSQNIHLNIDIIGHLARTGNWFYNLKKDFSVLDKIVNSTAKNVLSVDVSLYQNAGADMVQQLGYALAHANEYLNAFSDKKRKYRTICFKLAVGSNYFFEIAKLRALRLLWKTLAEEYGVTSDCHIIAIPTKRNKTLYAYNTNMLRTTTEVMAAVLGGADTVFNLSYDAVYHKDNDFAERIALNQLLLLKNESFFDKVENPADGTYYIEAITQQLAEKALLLFKSIEVNGGYLKQLKQHTIQKKIQESAKKEQELFENSEKVLVGTNKFQNANDKMKGSIELYPFLKTKPRKTLLQPILEKRLAEEVEQKRLEDE